MWWQRWTVGSWDHVSRWRQNLEPSKLIVYCSVDRLPEHNWLVHNIGQTAVGLQRNQPDSWLIRLNEQTVIDYLYPMTEAIFAFPLASIRTVQYLLRKKLPCDATLINQGKRKWARTRPFEPQPHNFTDHSWASYSNSLSIPCIDTKAT